MECLGSEWLGEDQPISRIKCNWALTTSKTIIDNQQRRRWNHLAAGFKYVWVSTWLIPWLTFAYFGDGPTNHQAVTEQSEANLGRSESSFFETCRGAMVGIRAVRPCPGTSFWTYEKTRGDFADMHAVHFFVDSMFRVVAVLFRFDRCIC